MKLLSFCSFSLRFSFLWGFFPIVHLVNGGDAHLFPLNSTIFVLKFASNNIRNYLIRPVKPTTIAKGYENYLNAWFRSRFSSRGSVTIVSSHSGKCTINICLLGTIILNKTKKHFFCSLFPFFFILILLHFIISVRDVVCHLLCPEQ